MRPTPTVMRMAECSAAWAMGASSSRSTAMPRMAPAGKTARSETYGSRPAYRNSTNAVYIPTAMNSPCEKFTMRITPKIRLSPIPTRA